MLRQLPHEQKSKNCLSGVDGFVALLFSFFLVLFWFGMVRHMVDTGEFGWKRRVQSVLVF